MKQTKEERIDELERFLSWTESKLRFAEKLVITCESCSGIAGEAWIAEVEKGPPSCNEVKHDDSNSPSIPHTSLELSERRGDPL